MTFLNEENDFYKVQLHITNLVFHLIAVITNLLVVVDRKYFYSNMILIVVNLLIPIFSRLSILLMLAFSLNRYALVCKPFTHHRITSRKSTFIQIIILAVIAVIGNIPTFLVKSSRMTLRIYKICAIITTVMIYFIPLIITLVLTVLVIYELNRSHGTLRASSVSTGARQGERNITRAMIVTIMAFVLLVFPSSIFIFIQFIITKDFAIPKPLYLTSKTLLLLYYINYSINIFVTQPGKVRQKS